MREWESFKDFFKALDEGSRYLVLRNYQDISDEGKAEGEHEDIDFLCDDLNCFEKISGCEPRKNKKDRIHQKISINGAVIPVDIRTVGDGYYDSFWEADMLKKRRRYADLFFIMDEKDEYYSLIYHAIIQKHSVSADYAKKLAAMSVAERFDEAGALSELEAFMKENNYRYTYPAYPGGIFHKEKGSKELVEKSLVKPLKRLAWKISRSIKGRMDKL